MTEEIEEFEVRDVVQATRPASAPEAGQALSPLAIPLNQLALDQAQAALALLPKFRRLLIQATSPADWIRLGKHAYPMDAAAMKIGQLAGVSFGKPSMEQSTYRDERGPVVMFVASITASYRGRTMEEEGTATSADQFFNGSEEVQEGEKTVKRTKRLPLSEIPIANVRKKAVTNAKGRAARKLLGLYFTPEEVESAFGDRGGSVAAVAYGGKSAEKNATTGRGEMTSQKKTIHDMMAELVDPPGDETKIGDMLEHITENKAKGWKGKRRVEDLTDNGTAYVYKVVKAEFDKANAEKGGAA